MSLPRFFLLTVSALGVVGSSLDAQVPRSPFMRPTASSQAVEQAAPVENAEFQFCGTFGDGAEKRFLIYNKTMNRSTWLKIGEEGPDGLFVDNYSFDNASVVVRQGNQTLNLALQAATITPGAARSAAPVQLAGNSNDLVTTVRANPTPADERQRLEAVAAEVRRRRALRQNAASGQAVSPPTPGQATP
tara:strand:- start:96 stop:662 length:567 start_codon:yes stop_codon:yes gene_type:complete